MTTVSFANNAVSAWPVMTAVVITLVMALALLSLH